MGGWVGGGMGGEGKGGVWVFSSLMKQNKKAKVCFVIHIAGKRFFFIYIYDVITWDFFLKSSANHYWPER
jgi:hypothetical protein